MRDGGRLPSPASIPSFASYNIRFLSLSQGQQKQREKKLRNIRKLVQKHTIVAVLETHCTGLKAVHCFFSEIEGVKVYYQEGKEAIVFLVDEQWSKENKPELISIIPGVMATLHWKAEGRDSWLTSFRLDAKDEKERISWLWKPSGRKSTSDRMILPSLGEIEISSENKVRNRVGAILGDPRPK